jgi:hypothetical protein
VPAVDRAPSHDEISQGDLSANLQMHSPLEKVPVAPVIDPLLDHSTDSSPKRPGVSIEVTQAAMQALLKSVADTSSVSPSRGSGSPVAAETIGNLNYSGSRRGNVEVVNAGFDVEQNRDTRKVDNGEVEQNTSMEHVLTEDGEPMLNPGMFELNDLYLDQRSDWPSMTS